MAIERQVGTLSEVINVYIRDSRNVSTLGMANVGATSMAYSWMRNNQATQSSGLCTAGGTLGTYGVSTFTQISSTSTLGWYQFGVPDGAFASGRSVVIHLWSKTSTVGVTPYSLEIDLLGNATPIACSTITTPVGVSSASVNFGISSAPILLGVSTLAVPVGVSSASVNLGVSTLATSVSSVTGQVTVSGATVNVGVSTLATSVSSVTGLVAVSTLATSVSSVTGSVNVSSYSRQVGVSSATVDFGVSTIAVAEKLVGVSTIAAGQKLVGISSAPVLLGVSTVTAIATSSIATGVWSTSTSADFGTSSSIGASLYGAFTIGTSVFTAPALANAPTGGGGTPVGVSSISVLVGVSTVATSVDVSSASVLLGVSTVTGSVDVSSLNSAPVIGTGTPIDLWRGV